MLVLVYISGMNSEGMKRVTKSLYTTKEIKEFKEQQIKLQNGIDPILGTPFPLGSICQDHDHDTQHCRAALHLQSNAWEGKVINAYTRCLKWLTDVPLPTILRNLADYLEKDYTSNPYHTGFMKKLKTEFNKLTASQQNEVLKTLGLSTGSNPKTRKDLFSKVVMDRSLGYDVILLTIKDVRNE